MQLYYYAGRDKTRSPLTGESVRFLPETNLRSANLMSHPSILLRPVLFSGAPAMAMLITIRVSGHRTTKVQRRSALLQVKYILLLFAVASGRARYRRVDASTDAFGRDPGTPPCQCQSHMLADAARERCPTDRSAVSPGECRKHGCSIAAALLAVGMLHAYGGEGEGKETDSESVVGLILYDSVTRTSPMPHSRCN